MPPPSGNLLRLKGAVAEQVVQELGHSTFLDDWCYTNPVLPNGKELCDFLFVYDNTALVWQIKCLKIRDDGLYREREVEKNLRQLIGAYRTLMEKKLSVVLKNPKRGSEEFNSETIDRVFLISAMMGEEPAHSTLMEERNGHVIHNFNRRFTEIALQELDTIADFVQYLRTKEDFLLSDKSVVINGGEEELLGIYLLNEKSFARFADGDFIVVEGDHWDHVKQKPEYIQKKKLDEVSYLWDRIIGRAHEGSLEYEIVARELARLTRFERRYMSKVMMDAWIQAHENKTHPMYRRMVSGRHASYCFLFLDETAPREYRKQMLGTICFLARDAFRNSAKVIGIASEKTLNPECSYDFCYINSPEWGPEAQRTAKRIREELGIFRSPEMKRFTEDEYPVEDG